MIQPAVLILVAFQIIPASSQLVHMTHHANNGWILPTHKFVLDLWNQSNITIQSIPPLPSNILITPDAMHLNTQETETPFSFVLNCKDESNVCKNVQNTLISAGKRIAKILLITETIQVSVTYRSFCDDDQPSCPDSRLLGQAYK